MATKNLIAAASSIPGPLLDGPIPAVTPMAYTAPSNSAVKLLATTLKNKTGSDVTVTIKKKRGGGSTSTFGNTPVGTSGSNTAIGTTNALFNRGAISHVVTANAVLTSLTAGIASAGTLGVSVGTISDGVYTERVRTTAVAVGTGAQTISPNINVYAGEVVGIHGTASIYHTASVGTNADKAVFSGGAVSTVVADRRWEFAFVVDTALTSVMFAGTVKANDSLRLDELDDHWLGEGGQITAVASTGDSVDITVSGMVFT